MPYVHCNKCHHEWECAENSEIDRKCDWCGSDSYILESQTPLSKMDIIETAIELIERDNIESNEIGKKIIKYGLKKKK